ncbi:MarR family transcriptional regulator [Oceanicola sp. 22II-s10i]|uniref:MarR family winged helix-turn-helix transcriptional regulator n=1 Tax=Oceanicola sp. 22II-s10i TaxID=1317116 RepID=UPI000B523A92|nr:MarR family transcriptional regulator [Oceanicola sp. 22II-s10i]OWU84793.1 MarR family transcriptional regulator [Oceanicola sp. 22II-s10i]
MTQPAYSLDAQVGYLMRRANQRHLAIFAAHIPALTPTQFAALARLCEIGPLSQNALGRAVAMDAATIKGVADRLRAKGLVTAAPDPDDRRRMILSATATGQTLFERLVDEGLAVSDETLSPLSQDEQRQFLDLLARLG